MSVSNDSFSEKVSDRAISVVTGVIGSVSVTGTSILALLWTVYFLYRARELSKKIHYLNKQTDERCEEELTNAKVDYVKSIFIAVISLMEIPSIYLTMTTVAFKHVLPQHRPNTYCLTSTVQRIHDYTQFRVVGAAGLSSIVVIVSLIHTLTLYLAGAYGANRVVRITRGVKMLLIFMLIQILFVWGSVLHWLAFIFVSIATGLVLFTTHLVVYCKYSSRTYLMFTRRRLDAWYEDQHLYKHLDTMCRDYRNGKRLYLSLIVCVSLGLIYALAITVAKSVVKNGCVIKEFSLMDYMWVSKLNSYLFFRILDDMIMMCMTSLLLLFLFIIHITIVCRIIRREMRQRKMYKSYVNNNKQLFTRLM